MDEMRQTSKKSGDGSGKSSLGIFAEFKKSQSLLRRFISSFLVSSHEIDDITQETFLRAYKAEKGRKIEFPRAFLFTIAKNVILSELSRKARKITDYIDDYDDSQSLLDTENLEDNVIAQQRLGVYCEAIAALPDQCRKVVMMKKVYGMQNKEIAARMEISLSTVEKHLSKGIKHCSNLISIRYQDELKSTGATGNQPTAKVFDSKRAKL